MFPKKQKKKGGGEEGSYKIVINIPPLPAPASAEPGYWSVNDDFS